jgi:hypothetical protein
MLLSVREVEKSQRMNPHFTLKVLNEEDVQLSDLLQSGDFHFYELRKTVKDGVTKYPCISVMRERTGNGV